MSKRSLKLLLEDMLEAANKILKYTHGLGFNEFLNDEKTMDAVIRNFEIIGEAANRIDPNFRTKHPDIEWERIRGFRNRIVHDYFGVDYKIVWAIIENDLKPLMDELKSVMKNMD